MIIINENRLIHSLNSLLALVQTPTQHCNFGAFRTNSVSYVFYCFTKFFAGMSPGDTNVLSSENMVLQTYKRRVRKTVKVITNEVCNAYGESSLSEQEPKKRMYEMSSSSLKSKRIRCSNDGVNCQDMNQIGAHDNNLCSSPGNSLHLIPKEHHIPSMGGNFESKMSRDDKAVIYSKGSPTIMLMNIADEQKKARLTKVLYTICLCNSHYAQISLMNMVTDTVK